MSAEGIQIIDAIQATFQNSDELSFIENIVTFQNEIDLSSKGIYPFMILSIDGVKITAADNQDRRHIERHHYPIKVFFSNRNKEQELVLRGDDSFSGLFDIHDNVRAVILRDPTFGGVVSKYPWMSDFANTVQNYEKDQYYIGRALMMFEVYLDKIIR